MPLDKPSDALQSFVSGSATDAPSSALQEFAQPQLDKDKYGGTGGQLASLGAGVARGLAPGVFDALAQKTGIADADTLNKLQQVNPGMSTAGQLAGTGGLLALTGGAAAPIAGGLEAIGVPGLAAAAIGTGLEGAALNQSQNLSDLSLGNPNVTAQKVIADAGMGLLLGGGLGALGHAAAPLVSDALTGALEKIKSFQPNPEMGPSATRGFVRNLDQAFQASRDASKDLYETAAPANIKAAVEASGLSVEEAKAAGADVISKLQEELPKLSSQGSAKLVSKRLDKLADELDNAKSAFKSHQALSDFAVDVDKKGLLKFDTLPTAAQKGDQDVLFGMRDAIRGNLKDPSLWGEEAATHYAETAEAYSDYMGAKKRFQQAFMKKDAGSKGYVVDPSKVSTFFKKQGDVSQDLRKQYLQDFMDKAGALANKSENYAGYQEAEGAISKHISKLAEEQSALKDVAEAMNKPKGGSSLLGDLPMAYAAHSLGVPSPVVGAAIGMHKAYKLLTNPYSQGSALRAAYSKLEALGTISEKIGDQISSQTRSIVRGGELPAGARAVVSEGASNYNKNVKKIDALANPEALSAHLEHTTNTLQESAPNVTQGIHTSMANAVNFLHSKVPRPHNNLPLGPKWEASPSQKAKFNRYFKAAQNPVGVLKEVKMGSLSNESMETLQTIYPELLQEMRNGLSESLNPTTAKKMPYAVKLSVSKFLGQPMIDSLLPPVVVANQANYGAMNQPPQSNGRKGGGKSTQNGLAKLDIGSRKGTETQDLEKEV